MAFKSGKRVKLLLAIAILFLLGAGSWYVFANKKDSLQFKTTKIEKGTLTASVSASGAINPVTSVIVGSQVSGQLKEVLVDFNSEVKAGQIIARIDPEQFGSRLGWGLFFDEFVPSAGQFATTLLGQKYLDTSGLAA